MRESIVCVASGVHLASGFSRRSVASAFSRKSKAGRPLPPEGGSHTIDTRSHTREIDRLFRAARRVAVAFSFLVFGSHVTFASPATPALLTVVKTGDVAAVRELVRKHADVNAADV